MTAWLRNEASSKEQDAEGDNSPSSSTLRFYASEGWARSEFVTDQCDERPRPRYGLIIQTAPVP